MRQGTILVVGSLNMDQIVRVPHIPALGETLPGAGSLLFVPGGKGANQAVAMARLGGQVVMAGRVGADPFGTQLLTSLRTAAVTTDLIVVDEEEASGVAFIFLTPEGDNAIVVTSGANARVGQDQEQLERIFIAMRQSRALVMQLEIPLETVQLLTAKAHHFGIPATLNLAPAHPLPPEMLSQLSVLIVNESEASLLTGQRVEQIDDARAVAMKLHAAGAAMVVVTLGEQGAILVTTDEAGQVECIYQAAPQVNVVDTTAAGDCFVGALTVALVEGRRPAEALRFAVHASALKVTKFGAQPGLPTRAEVLAAYGH